MSTTIPAQQVTRLFTFGYGHLCPYTGEELGDHYALVTAPDASSARTFMNTAFKRNWAFEYDGVTDRRIADYVPGMKLHLQVVLLPNADPTGLAYTRADDDAEDPTPTGPREPLHTGGMTEGGLVDETGDGSYLVDHGPVKPPYGTPEREAYERNQAVDEPVGLLHFSGGEGFTLCGLHASGLPWNHHFTTLDETVTCSDCKATS